MAELTRDEKIRWLSAKYFGISNIHDDDFNPYKSIDIFLKSTVGSLRWGIDQVVRQDSKSGFSDTFMRELAVFHVNLGLDDIAGALKDDIRTNLSVVEEWAGKAKFPSNNT